MKLGAKIDASVSADTVLICAKNNDLETLQVLIGAKADVNSNRLFDSTPLSISVSKGYVEFTRALLVAGAKPNAYDSYGKTPLYVATKNANFKMVDILLKAGADKNKKILMETLC